MSNSISHRDEQALFESALGDPDQLLLDALRSDERRRRRRRTIFFTLLLGGMIMAMTLFAVFAGWLTLAALPDAHAQDARIEQAESLAGEGWQLWQQQKFADAATKFEKAVELDPDSANAWNGLGWARFNGGDGAGA